MLRRGVELRRQGDDAAALVAFTAAYGALPDARNPRKNVARSAVGRNVALFDDTRHWAYKAIERFWGAPTVEWSRAVLHQAHTYNETRIASDFSTR